MHEFSLGLRVRSFGLTSNVVPIRSKHVLAAQRLEDIHKSLPANGTEKSWPEDLPVEERFHVERLHVLASGYTPGDLHTRPKDWTDETNLRDDWGRGVGC